VIQVSAAMPGTVVGVEVAEGDAVQAGQTLVVVEAMKMEQPVVAPAAGIVRRLEVALGGSVVEGQAVAVLEPSGAAASEAAAPVEDLDAIRPDLAELRARVGATLDEGRLEAVARRRATGQRTARENVADLCDPGSFIEYGGLALAAQRQRRTPEELMKLSPADGLVAGIGAVDGARTMVLAYDYTVFAGTQGGFGHKKLDRMLALALEHRLPTVLFAEGGGGRPGDTDMPVVAGLDTPSFLGFAALSGQAPTVGIVSGRCFAGNAALLGCCDVIIATENSNVGMAGPAMIEGGGLGAFPPEAIGPIDVQWRNGVVDLRVADEAAGVAAARKYLGYFRGPRAELGAAADQRALRALVPDRKSVV